jgi:hypothetical protein
MPLAGSAEIETSALSDIVMRGHGKLQLIQLDSDHPHWRLANAVGGEITFLTRMGERILGVLIGGLSVYLGYSLFTKLPDKTDSSGKVILPGGVSIWLSRVGPGIFFALFGATIVVTAFRQEIETKFHHVENTTDPAGVKRVTEDTRTRRGVGPATSGLDESEAEQRVAEARTQISTLNRDWLHALRNDLHADDRNLLEVARDYSKHQILRAVWLQRWGSPAEFESWLLSGARPPAPSEPARIYLLDLEASR